MYHDVHPKVMHVYKEIPKLVLALEEWYQF